MSVIEYQKLKYNVSQGINWITEGRQLLYMGKPFLPNDCENNIQDVLSFLDKLEEEKHVAIDSLEVLKDLLEGIEKWNLLQMVKKFESKRKEYKSLLEQCGRELDERSQLEQLISICEGKISHDRQGHMTDIWTLFTELEKENNLGIKRLEILKTMAIKMKKPYLLQQVEKFENKREQEEDAERERRRSQVQTAAVLASARYAGGRLMGIVTPQCTFRNVTGGIVVVTTWMILRRSSSLQEFVHTFTEAVLPLGNTLRAISEGSLCFTVQAETTSALEALWKTYQDGTLQRNIQEFLVTEEIKQLVGSEVSLTVKIDEQEYKDAVCDLEAEMEEKEEWKGFEDQSSSDPAHARVREAHPEVREEISQNTELNLPEFGLYEDTGDIQGILERVDEGMKEISKKLDILTEPGGVAARDEDILDNIQQVRKEMIHIGKTLEMLRKPEKKTKNAELELRAKERMERMELELELGFEKQRKELEYMERMVFGKVFELERMERMAFERMELELERKAKELELELERKAKELERKAKELERKELELGKERMAKALRDSSPSVPSLSSVGGGLADVKVEVEPKQQKQKEGSRVEFK